MNHQNQSNPTSSSGTPKESKWKKWGTAAGEKAMKLSDKVSPYVNGAAASESKNKYKELQTFSMEHRRMRDGQKWRQRTF